MTWVVLWELELKLGQLLLVQAPSRPQQYLSSSQLQRLEETIEVLHPLAHLYAMLSTVCVQQMQVLLELQARLVWSELERGQRQAPLEPSRTELGVHQLPRALEKSLASLALTAQPQSMLVILCALLSAHQLPKTLPLPVSRLPWWAAQRRVLSSRHALVFFSVFLQAVGTVDLGRRAKGEEG